MANGFVSSSPATRHGASTSPYDGDYPTAQRFSCPGSGTQELSEIGLWAYKYSGLAKPIKLAVWTDDASNNCPGSMVTNSETDAINVTSSSMAKNYFTYSTKPQLTGGVNYWLGFINDNDASNQTFVDYYDTTGKSTIFTTKAYPSWPTSAEWHTSDWWARADLGIYAVYAAAAQPLPVFDYNFNNMRP